MSSTINSSQRDIRIDFFRGVVLLQILWNHLIWIAGSASIPIFLKITPTYWGLSDAAFIFIFLSGYVYGVVYNNIFDRSGFLTGYLKSAERAWQLYVANMITLLITLGLLSFWLVRWDISPLELESHLINHLFAPSTELFWHLLTLRFLPAYFEILPLYTMLLLIVPVIFALMRRNIAAALVLSLLLYVIAQFGVNLPALYEGSGVWYFNPLAWQLLFVVGVFLGWKKPSLPKSPILLGTAALILVAAALYCLLRTLVNNGILSADSGFVLPLSGKTNLEPLTLVHFFALAYLIAVIVNPSDWVWKQKIIVPVAKMGRHSLEVFCFGLVYTYMGGMVIRTINSGWPFALAMMLTGCLASVGFAYTMQWRKQISLRKRIDKTAEPVTNSSWVPLDGQSKLINDGTSPHLKYE